MRLRRRQSTAELPPAPQSVWGAGIAELMQKPMPGDRHSAEDWIVDGQWVGPTVAAGLRPR